MSCEHSYSYQGTVYWLSNDQIAGSGAYPRLYGDRYYCTKCLNNRLENIRTIGNSYSKPVENTLPA